MHPSMNSFEELLQSLPSEPAWGTDIFLYNGFWFLPAHLKLLVSSQTKFQASDTDILLATFPKSGTTWLKALVFAITKRFEYDPTDPNHPLHSSNPHVLVPFFERGVNLDIPSPRLVSTHTPYHLLPPSVKTTKCRVIYLCRDPKDVFISAWHFLKEVMPSSDPLEENFELFCKGIVPYGPFWDHAKDYWNISLKEPEKVLFLKYNDLKAEIVSQVKTIAEFVGLPISTEEESKGVIEKIAEMCTFNNLSNLDVNKSGALKPGETSTIIIKNKEFFRKGEVGDWKNYITPSMGENLDQVVKQKLLGSALKFE